ncbi:ammonium transporter family [Fragilaria crotonensis]|nr:ammonium transporter family [Fragilaria crotonensis]
MSNPCLHNGAIGTIMADCANETLAEGADPFSCAIASATCGIAEGVNTFFLLYAGAIVFMMQAGFAMLCAGTVRQKNVKNIMLKNLLDACGGALGFYTVGYGFAYGSASGDYTSARFIGNYNFFLMGLDSGYQLITWFFQFAFAASAATIVAGSIAERCKMAAYLCYSVFLTGFVYPVIVHSIWSADGFLVAFGPMEDKFRGLGVIDFAGSGVVHMTGGVTALIAAIVLGPRRGRFYDEDGNPLETPTVWPPHSVALQILGTFILWIGWYGFNPGSTLFVANPTSAGVTAHAAVTSTIAGASGCISAMFLDTIVDCITTGDITYDLSMAMNGALAALVAITAGCSVVDPWAALVIGVIGGWVYYGCSKLMIKLRIDDVVDAVPVHFGNGAWGLIAVGFFANPANTLNAYSKEIPGVFYGGGDLLLNQIVAVCWIFGWVAATMTPFFVVLKMAGMFRVDALEEDVGLDISHHRGAGYDMSVPDPETVEKLMEVRSSNKVEVPNEVADDDKDDEDV